MSIDRVIRLFKIALVLIIWYFLGLAAVAFSIDTVLIGIFDLIAVGIFVFILLDGRLFRMMHDRPIPGKFLLGMYVAIILGIDAVIRDIRFNDIYVLGELYIPGVITSARAVGTLILTAILFWETVALTRQHFASKQ